MKRYLSATLLCLLLVLTGNSGVASAHVLKQDHGMSAVLHIPPEDNPKAGQPTDLELTFGNAGNSFRLSDCNCGVAVLSNGRTIQTASLQASPSDQATAASATVQFPTIGVYDVIVSGRSKTAAFTTFRLDYLIRVPVSVTAPQPALQHNGLTVVMIGITSFVILGMIAYTAIKQGNYQQRKK